MKESKSFTKEEKIMLYHGGPEEVKYPTIGVRGYAKDFGWGFYTTVMKKQAEKWSLKNKKTSVVSTFEYNENKDLKILRFESMTEEWLDFIIFCRQGKLHDYDIVEGPMADDTIYDFITDYIEGVINRETFWSYAKFKYPTHQLSFHTLKSLSCLDFINSYDCRKGGGVNGISRV